MIRSVARFAGTRSVRARIIVLATIPILGFLASSIAYVTGEAEVQATFERMKRAAALADNSQDFKEALSSMRIYARDFAARPRSRRSMLRTTRPPPACTRWRPGSTWTPAATSMGSTTS